MSTYFVPQLDYRDDEENLSLVVIESVETEAWRFYANWAALRVESLQSQRVGVSSGDAHPLILAPSIGVHGTDHQPH
ncbi:hypothetical protein PPTG_08376 [Phytophthora nicotianae INRA-310]|uniref:Uncharacterized protein n=1 Tax=Phytophthora nicotianae (strain INRA-310) TaxID=761204 RepID=W2QM71_PHYN3|nr:hypothetical protein PPTG_08376 [Phytophthora nicotianae INRA-310]ETN13619.1 hypothetical protein PPTG_08376 [Phytophthora nicotianae INRA-310]